jgi:hypothetical protein
MVATRVNISHTSNNQKLPSITAGTGENVFPIAFTPDARGLRISRQTEDVNNHSTTFEIWGVQEGRVLRTIFDAGKVYIPRVETDRLTLAVVSAPYSSSGPTEYTLTVSNIPTGDLLQTCHVTAAASPFLLIDPAGNLFCVRDDADGVIKVGSMRSAGPMKAYTYNGTPPYRVISSPRHDRFIGLASSPDPSRPDVVMVWQADRPSPVQWYDEDVAGI